MRGAMGGTCRSPRPHTQDGLRCLSCLSISCLSYISCLLGAVNGSSSNVGQMNWRQRKRWTHAISSTDLRILSPCGWVVWASAGSCVLRRPCPAESQLLPASPPGRGLRQRGDHERRGAGDGDRVVQVGVRLYCARDHDVSRLRRVELDREAGLVGWAVEDTRWGRRGGRGARRVGG